MANEMYAKSMMIKPREKRVRWPLIERADLFSRPAR